MTCKQCCEKKGTKTILAAKVELWTVLYVQDILLIVIFLGCIVLSYEQIQDSGNCVIKKAYFQTNVK